MNGNEIEVKDITCQCKTCGDFFTIEKNEVLFYARKNLQLPTHCKYCRVIAKAQRLCGNRRQKPGVRYE